MIDFENVSLGFADSPLFENVNFKINKSDKIGLVGINGAGKTTLLNLILGNISPDKGEIRKQKNIQIGYLPQEIIDSKEGLLFDNVRNSLQTIRFIEKEEEALSKLLSDGGNLEKDNLLKERFDRLENLKERFDYYSVNSRIEKVLSGLGFSAQEFNKPVGEFSGGWQMRIELAKILLEDNNILLMDEPTNHLDIDSLEWLISFLKNYKGALLIVSHDKNFLNEVTFKTLEISNAKVTLYNGNYDEYLKFKEEKKRELTSQRKNLEKKKKETEKFIERFRYKATKAKQVQSRIKALSKLELPEIEEDEEIIDIKFPEPPRSGAVTVELSKISKSFGTIKLFDSVDLKIERGEKIAIVGPNGAGKSTLTKIITGKLLPDTGTVKYGHNVKVSFYSQDVADNLDLSKTVWEIMLSAGSQLTEGKIRSVLGAFLFKGDDVFKKVKVLSGGEKSRLALAKLLITAGNLIVLDEPTNHLDFKSKEALKKALTDFPASVIIVTHDVDFLRNLVSKTFDIRNGKIKIYYGGIDYYLSKKFDFKDEETRKEVSNKPSGKKEEKRLQAELRAEKYRATKDLKENISKIELMIEDLENGKIKIEKELSEEKIFSNPTLAKEKNQEYSEILNKLEKAYEEWTSLTERLETIEKSFSEKMNWNI